MPRLVPIQILSAERAALDAQAAAAGLLAREPYFVTDEQRLAVGLSADAYRGCLMEGDAIDVGIAVRLADGSDVAMPAGAPSPVDLNAKLDAQGGTLNGYLETGALLTIASGELTIPLDGRIYAATLDQAVSLLTSDAPTPPICGSAILYLQQASPAEAVTLPAWYWPNGEAEAFDADGALYRLTLYTDPLGNIHADATRQAVPA